MNNHRTALVWFRRDLRLADNPALLYAAAHATRIIPLYIHHEPDAWPTGAASNWW
ncbi:MAG: deoxyribodipyrimidine photo-lyase, partial [Povalibacter sp.]